MLWDSIVIFIRLFLVSEMVLTVGCSQSSPQVTDEQKLARIENIRQALGLEYPYRIERGGFYLSGDYGAEFIGRRGTSVEFSWLGAVKLERVGDSLFFPPRNLYLGSTSPRAEGAIRLEVGSPEERVVLAMLKIYVEDNLPSPLRDSVKFYHRQRELSRHRLVEKFYQRLTEEQMSAIALDQVVGFVEDQRNSRQ